MRPQQPSLLDSSTDDGGRARSTKKVLRAKLGSGRGRQVGMMRRCRQQGNLERVLYTQRPDRGFRLARRCR